MTVNAPSFIQPADRIASFQPYFFASLNQRIAALKARGVDVIRLDMGSPDLPPADFIIDELVETARRANAHGYMPMGGTPEFRKACAVYYGRRFGVELDPAKEVLGLIGSKEGLFNLSQVLLNPGDVSIVPDPGYPVYSAGGIIAGAEIYTVPLLEENHYLPQLDQIPAEIARRAKILWLNYPNNPTGAVAPLSFLAEVVDFARRNQILVAHDAPYVDVCFDGYTAPSIMQVPGAADVAVEFNSLSKTYSITGWRLGYVMASEPVIAAARKVHDFLTVGAAAPLQEAAIAGLELPDTYYTDFLQGYATKRDLFLSYLKQTNLPFYEPQGAYYILVDISSLGFADDIHAAEWLVKEIGVAGVPGSSFFRTLPSSQLRTQDSALSTQMIRFHFAKKEETLRAVGERLLKLRTKN